MRSTKLRIVRMQINNLLNTYGPFTSTTPVAERAIVDRLRSDLATLEKCWSKMAIRNLLVDLTRGVSKLRASVTDGTMKTKCMSVEAALGKLLKTHDPTRARYDNALLFGWRVKCADDKFTGLSEDWADMQEKCADMISAIRGACNLAGIHNSDGGMLKIFMAPEFYFRGKNGAYEHSLVTGCAARTPENGPRIPARKGLLDLLRDEIDKPQYKDWLFVCGSAIMAARMSTVSCAFCNGPVRYVVDSARPGKTKPQCRADASHAGTNETSKAARIDNLAIVLKEKTTYTVAKELVSHIDFVTDKAAGITYQVNVRGEALNVMRRGTTSGYDSADPVASTSTDERMGGSVFTLDGITFGLEVCLDHGASVGSAAKGRLSNAANIQILLIPSAGMSIMSFPTVKGGIIFNVDGLTPHCQVVGGAEDLDIRHDFVDRLGSEWEMQWAYVETPDSVTRYPFSDDAFTDLNDWNDLGGAGGPKIATARRGSVLAYGPFEIPKV